MKTFLKQNRTFLFLGLVFTLMACTQDEQSLSDAAETEGQTFVNKNGTHVNMFKGPSVNYGLGKARSYIYVNGDGFPVELGVEFTPEVMDDLSLLVTDHELEIVLPLHKKATDLTSFEHIALNYQPNGHAPRWWEEHFDFHFYTMTNEERLAIPDYDASNQSIVDAFNYFPDMTKMPADYFKFPSQLGVLPLQGKHWHPLDWLTNYNPFTHVMIMGTYAQKNNFIEPMVTVDYLLSGEHFSGNYSQPQTFEEPGNNYPTKYNIYHDSETGKIYISLSDFVRR